MEMQGEKGLLYEFLYDKFLYLFSSTVITVP